MWEGSSSKAVATRQFLLHSLSSVNTATHLITATLRFDGVEIDIVRRGKLAKFDRAWVITGYNDVYVRDTENLKICPIFYVDVGDPMLVGPHVQGV